MIESKPWLNHYDKGVPQSIVYPQIPLFAFLQEKAAQDPHKLCTIYDEQTITYAQMDKLTDELAAALIHLGLHKGDRVALFLPNIPQFVVSFFGILKMGGVVVAINPTYKESEVNYQLNDSGAVAVICISTAASLFLALRPLSALKLVVITNVEDSLHGSNEVEGIYWLENLLSAHYESTRPEVVVTPDDPAIFQYSGGTTGIPKAAIGLHRNIVANTLQFGSLLLPIRSEHDVILAAIPLFHVYGMVLAMCLALVIDAAIVLISNARDIPHLVGSIEKYRATIFPGVPNLFLGINRFIETAPNQYDLTSLRACISGSTPLPGHIKAKFEQMTGSRLMEGYGLSEAPTAATCNPVRGENKAGSIGLPLPDVDVKIISLEDEKTPLGIGDVGELVIQAPQVMAGYHSRPEETRIAIRDGWLYTGDVAYMDKDGYLYLVDRKKDVIKVGGLQVWPREVEETIALNPKVEEVAVAGVMHADFGETVKAWVIKKPGQEMTAEEVINWCKAHLANFKAPRQIEFVTQLPRTTVGKVLRRELVRLNK